MYLSALFAILIAIAPLLVPEHHHSAHIGLHLLQFVAMASSLYVMRRFGKFSRPVTVLITIAAIVGMLGVLLLLIGHSLALSANTP
jgi:uncharacterized membrane protein